MFKKELTELINKYCLENGSCTPDYILAEYIENCLKAFDIATEMRDKWYNQDNCNKSTDSQLLPDVSEIVLNEKSTNDEKVLLRTSTFTLTPISDDEISQKIMLIYDYINRRIGLKMNNQETREWVIKKFYDILGIFNLGNYIITIFCDESNNPPEIIDMNQLVVDIEYSIHGYNTFDLKKVHLTFGAI